MAQEAVEKTPWNWVKGTAEAVIGAFVWTLILILLAFILHWSGVDFDEVFRHVSG